MGESFWDGATSKDDVDIPAFFDSSIIDGVIALLQMGVLVSFGTTRDRGAVSIAIFDNGRRSRKYFRHSEDANDYLRDAADALGRAGVGARNGDLRDR